MKRVAVSAGFTIVETMIVIAVTGLLFLAVAAGWGGRQKYSEYQTALAATRASLQQVISDVNNGYFPATNNVRCRVQAGALKFSSGTNEQGSNSQCLFLGKAVQFKNLGGDLESYQVYTVAGIADSSTVAGLVDPSAIIDATKPTIVPGMTENPPLAPDFQTVRIKANGTINNYSGFIIMTDPGSYSGGVLNSGQQVIRLYGLKGHVTSGPFPLNINPSFGYKLYGVPPMTQYDPINADNNGMQICFKSGATNNYGLITIGANGNAGDVTAETRQTANCGLVP